MPGAAPCGLCTASCDSSKFIFVLTPRLNVATSANQKNSPILESWQDFQSPCRTSLTTSDKLIYGQFFSRNNGACTEVGRSGSELNYPITNLLNLPNYRVLRFSPHPS